MTTLTLPGLWQDFGWSVDQEREVTQRSISDWSDGRVILLHQTLDVTPLGPVQGRGQHYCTECGTIFESVLLPEIIKDCPVCSGSSSVSEPVPYRSHWNYWRFLDFPKCADAPGRVYLFSIPGQEDALKFGFSYSPLKRSKGSPLYGELLWESPMTTRAIARTVELDLHQSVKGGLFAEPVLTLDQSSAAGSTETFLLRPSWDLNTIVCHLEATYNKVNELGWQNYWLQYLPGIDGSPSNGADLF